MTGCGCSGGNPPTSEVCNNTYDNCNGQIDEGLSACGCSGGNPPVSEVCNNSDDNCNEEIDEGLPACQCSGGNAPGTEVCDGVDNDCNEQIDEDNGSGGGCAEFGDPCNSFNDCISQVCVGDQFERYCTEECDPAADPSTWPADYRCYVGPNLDYYLRDYLECDNNLGCAPDDVCTVQDADDQLSKVTECRPPLDSGGDPGDDCETAPCANGICSWHADLCSEVCSAIGDCLNQYLLHDTTCILSGYWVTPGDCGRDEQCPGGYVCQDSICLCPVCSDDGECDPGYSCRPPEVTPPDNVCQPLPFYDYLGTCSIACDGDPDCPASLLCFPGVAVDYSVIQGFCDDPSAGDLTDTGAGPCGAGYDNCTHAICYGSGATSYCTQLCADASDCPGGMNCTPGTFFWGSLGEFENTFTCTNP
ncbi:MAG: hypothetical protein JRJ19_02245 [Deltaproteobacteria bacterium]|nr:hypothetical protein [Deltaproteobacteria bacterium]